MNDSRFPEKTSPSLTITSVKRISGRAVLTLSDGSILSMPRSMLKERPYRCGMDFDHQKHQTFMDERSYSFAMEKAVAALAARAKSEKELVDALRKNAYPEQAIARVMAYLTEAGYINDNAFACQWSTSRVSKGMGSRRIRMELRQKGIDSEQIDRAIDSIDKDDQLNQAIIIAQKHARGKDLSSPSDKQKILAALARRGYDFTLAKQALSHILNENF